MDVLEYLKKNLQKIFLNLITYKHLIVFKETQNFMTSIAADLVKQNKSIWFLCILECVKSAKSILSSI